MNTTDTDRMTWLWADQTTPGRPSITISTATSGIPGYRYYHRDQAGQWRLIAVAANEAQSVNWYAHPVTPEDAPADVAAWLDGVAASIPPIKRAR